MEANEEHVNQLLSMGFHLENVRKALKVSKNDMIEAVAILTDDHPTTSLSNLYDVELDTAPSNNNGLLSLTDSVAKSQMPDSSNLVTNLSSVEATVFKDEPLEFPLVNLYELENRVFNDSWSIPYKKEESLSICLVSAIRYAKEGLCDSDPNCSRFMYKSMIEAFNKLLSTTVVHRWSVDIQEGIFEMLQLLVELVIIRMKTDPLPVDLLRLLALVFNSESEFNVKNRGKFSERTQHWDELFGDRPITIRPPDKEPYGWLTDLINQFAELQGFELVRDRLQVSSSDIDEMLALFSLFGHCSEFLNGNVVCLYLSDAMQSAINFACQLNDFKEKNAGNVCELLMMIKLICKNLWPDKVADVEKLRVDITLKMLKSNHFNAKMNALKEVTKMIEDSQSKDASRSPEGQGDIVDWIVNERVLSIALEGNIDKVQYCNKIKNIVEYLGSKLSDEEIEKIWSMQSGEHSAVIDNIHNIISAAAIKFNNEQFENLVILIQKTWMEERSFMKERLLKLIGGIGRESRNHNIIQRVLELLWELAHLHGLKVSLLERALLEHLQIINDPQNVKEPTKKYYIMKCVENIKEGAWILPALNHLTQIVKGIARSSFHKTQRGILQDLNKNQQIIELVTKSLSKCHDIIATSTSSHTSHLSSSSSLLATSTTSSSTITNTREDVQGHLTAHQNYVNAHLEFLQFVLVEGCLYIPWSGCKEVWSILVSHPHASPWDRDVCYSWLSKSIKDMEHDTQRKIFYDEVLFIDPSKLSSAGFSCFKCFFEEINAQENKLRVFNNNIIMDTTDLHGLDYLWRICLTAVDNDIADQAIHMLLCVSYLNLDPKFKRDPQKLHRKFINECYNWLECVMKQPPFSSSASLSSSSSSSVPLASGSSSTSKVHPKDAWQSSAASNGIHDTILSIERLLLLAERYVISVEDQYNMVRGCPPHGASFQGRYIKLHVSCDSPKMEFPVMAHSNESIRSLKRKIADKMSLNSDLIHLLASEKMQQPYKDGKLLHQSGLDDGQVVNIRVSSSALVSYSSSQDLVSTIGMSSTSSDYEKQLPGVLMSNDAHVFKTLYKLASLDLPRITCRVRNLLTLIPTDPEVLRNFDVIGQKRMKCSICTENWNASQYSSSKSTSSTLLSFSSASSSSSLMSSSSLTTTSVLPNSIVSSKIASLPASTSSIYVSLSNSPTFFTSSSAIMFTSSSSLTSTTSPSLSGLHNISTSHITKSTAEGSTNSSLNLSLSQIHTTLISTSTITPTTTSFLSPEDLTLLSLSPTPMSVNTTATHSAAISNNETTVTTTIDKLQMTKSLTTMTTTLQQSTSSQASSTAITSPSSLHKQQQQPIIQQTSKEVLASMLNPCAPGMNLFRVLYNIEVLSSHLIPAYSVDSISLQSAQIFCQDFLEAGGLNQIVSVLQCDAINNEERTDQDTRQGCYAICLQLLRFLLCGQDGTGEHSLTSRLMSPFSPPPSSDVEPTTPKMDINNKATPIKVATFFNNTPSSACKAVQMMTSTEFTKMIECFVNVAWHAATGRLQNVFNADNHKCTTSIAKHVDSMVIDSNNNHNNTTATHYLFKDLPSADDNSNNIGNDGNQCKNMSVSTFTATNIKDSGIMVDQLALSTSNSSESNISTSYDSSSLEHHMASPTSSVQSPASPSSSSSSLPSSSLSSSSSRDKYICCESLELLVTCLQLNPSLITSFLSIPNISNFLIDVLVTSPHEDVRMKAVEQLFIFSNLHPSTQHQPSPHTQRDNQQTRQQGLMCDNIESGVVAVEEKLATHHQQQQQNDQFCQPPLIKKLHFLEQSEDSSKNKSSDTSTCDSFQKPLLMKPKHLQLSKQQQHQQDMSHYSPRHFMLTVLRKARLPFWISSTKTRGISQKLLRQCREYFMLLSRLLCHLTVLDQKNMEVSIKSMLNDEIRWLKNFVCCEDPLLVEVDNILLMGHLHLIRNLLTCQGVDKKYYGSILIEDILFNFLFPASRIIMSDARVGGHVYGGGEDGEEHDDKLFNNFNAKCSMPMSRMEAYNLLIELSNEELDNLTCISNQLSLMHHQSNNISANQWEYMPPVDGRTSCGFVGLKNGGATCYMNSVIQQLHMTPGITEYLLSLDDERIEEGSILYQIQHVLGHLQESKLQYYIPQGFWEVFKLWGVQVNIREQQDALDFFQALIDQLDEQIKKLGREEIFKKTFQGFFSDQKICKGCKHSYEQEEPFFALNVTVKHATLQESLDQFVKGELLDGDNAYFCELCGVKRDTIKRLCVKSLPPMLCIQLKRFDYDWEANRAIKFDDYFKFPMTLDMEPYTAEGMAWREEMTQLDSDPDSDSSQTMLNSSNNDDADIFDDPIMDVETNPTNKKRSTMRNVNISISHPTNHIIYELVGVVVHSGQANAGHYYSFIKDRRGTTSTNPNKHKWHKFNDTTVEEFEMNDANLEAECFGGKYQAKVADTNTSHTEEHQRYWNGYLLFFERMEDTKCPTSAKKSKVTLFSSQPNSGTCRERCDAGSEQWENHNSLKELAELVHKGEKRGLFGSHMPVRVQQLVRAENLLFIKNRNIFELEYFSFIRRLVSRNMHLTPSSHATEIQLQSLKFALIFLFNTYYRTKFKLRLDMDEWENIIINLILKSHESTTYMMKFLSNEGLSYMKPMLLDCPSKETRSAMSRYLEVTIKSCLQYDSHHDPMFTTNRDFDTIIDTLLSWLEKDVPDNCKQSIQYFYVLYTYAQISFKTCGHLIVKNAFKKLMEFLLGRTVDQDYTNRRWGSLQSRDFGLLHNTLATLVLCTDVTSYKTHDSTHLIECGEDGKDRNVTGTSNTDVDLSNHKSSATSPAPTLTSKTSKFIMPPEMSRYLYGDLSTRYMHEIVQALRELPTGVELIQQMLLHCCHDNKPFSIHMLTMLFDQCLNAPPNEMKNVFATLLNILLLEDHLQHIRLKYIMEEVGDDRANNPAMSHGMLDLMKQNHTMDSKRSYHFIKFLVNLSNKSPLAKDYLLLRVAKWQWAVKWLSSKMVDNHWTNNSNHSWNLSNEETVSRSFQRTISAQGTLADATALLTELESHETKMEVTSSTSLKNKITNEDYNDNINYDENNGNDKAMFYNDNDVDDSDIRERNECIISSVEGHDKNLISLNEMNKKKMDKSTDSNCSFSTTLYSAEEEESWE